MEKVRDRLQRAVRILGDANIPYSVIGGNAVAAWVSRVDEAAVRNTQDVDILLRRQDMPAAIEAWGKAGFIYRHASGIDMFLDGAAAKARDAVHVIFAEEKVRPEYASPAPSVDEVDSQGDFRVLSLAALVQMQLTSFHRNDQMHLTDLLDVGLIDASWLDRVPVDLRPRLKEIIDNPEG